MRGRLLGGFILALASMTAWAGALPFAKSAPIAIAYNQTEPDVAAPTRLPAPEESFAAKARATAEPAPTQRSPRFEGRWAAAPVQLSTPAPQTATQEPADTPEPADQPDPTAMPEPTASATPKATESATPKPTTSLRPKPSASPTPQPTAAPTPPPTASPTLAPTAPPAASYTGRSHFWYPALNIDTSWQWYGCDYGGDAAGLGGGIYRWGCGPTSNIYMLSHAWSTFKKLKTAYHDGTLRIGQNVWYANAQGDVTRWEVEWIRRVTDEYLDATASEWALNDSPTPIMTLQTCDGAQDQYRIIVRLVPAN